MARVSSFDHEIGRGRRGNGEGSSSSRESSPACRPPKRSFSPRSDDGCTVIQDVEDNDQTPSPVERPILRQALAFSGDPPTQVPVNTYEANVAIQPKKSCFLPGQEVPLPSKQQKGGSSSSSSGKRNKTGVKRPRRPDAYPGQTTRFRLDTYDPTPPSEPPIDHGTGPYSSLYRGVPPARTQVTRQNTSVGSSSSSKNHGRQSRTSSLPLLENANVAVGTALSGRGDLAMNDNNNNPNGPPLVPPPQPSRGLQTRSVTASLNDLTSQQSRAPTPRGTSSPVPSMSLRERTSPGPYYRRNYDNRSITPPQESQQPAPKTKSSSSDTSSQKKNLKAPPRIVTLLIEDVRSEPPDQQLAEVKVPLRKADDPEQGWWADAKDIAEQLQAGPSRIDGPARAFTMRGKYRQFILRVTTENKDEILSANVAVAPEKTLELIVELLCPPGAPPRPAPIWGPSYDEYDRRSDERMEIESSVRHVSESRKRQHSPSFDDYGEYHHSAGSNKIRRRDGGGWDASSSSSPRRQSPTLYGSSYRSLGSDRDRDRDSWSEGSRSRDRGKRRGSYSPGYPERVVSPPPPPPPPSSHIRTPQPKAAYARREGDEEEEEEEQEFYPNEFIRTVERLLRDDLEVWNDYFKASSGNRTCDVVKRYEVVTRMFMMWVGKRPPGFSRLIEENHIIRALEIEDGESFLEKCKETMGLLKLYGQKGRVHEDSRVLEMLNDQRPPPPPLNTDPGRKLLRLLRGIDDAWKRDRSGPMLDGIMPPGPDPYDRPGPYSPAASAAAPGGPSSQQPPPPSTPAHTHTTVASPTSLSYNTQSRSSSTVSQSENNNSSSVQQDTALLYSSRGNSKGMFVD